MKKVIFSVFILIISWGCEKETEYKDLVAYYPFSGNALDYSDNSLNGKIFGAILTTDRNGLTNNALYFDGVDDYVKIDYDSPLNIRIPFTFSAWINPEQISSSDEVEYNVIFAQSAPYDEIYSLGIRDRIIVCGHMGTSYSMELNQWTLYSVTMNEENNVSFYINGDLVRSFSHELSNAIINGEYNGDLYIGKDENDFEYHFKGKIDDIRIYNRCLNENEIKFLFLK
jgi:hypothetical protein